MIVRTYYMRLNLVAIKIRLLSRGTNECAVFTLGNNTDISLFSAINE